MSKQLLVQSRQRKLELFLQKYKKHLSKQVKELSNQGKFQLDKIKCTIISDNDKQQTQLAGQRLHQGQLVAFPTETVYGLGANALNEKALLKIFETKKRPLSDPIIVHILNPEDAFKYVQITEKQFKYFELLSQQFWPGPLTIILKANLQVLPLVVTAQTGYVGIRCPNHPYFRKLLKQSQLPIGAPSANLFSHVSPTEAVHVFNDFYKDNVWLVDGGKCEFGIESTVLKILDNQIKIFRQGSLAFNKIKQFLVKRLGQNAPKIQIIKKTSDQSQNTEAPGQLLKHYSPNIPCFFTQNLVELQKCNPQELKQIGFISFSNTKYGHLSEKLGSYFRVGKSINLPEDLQNKQQEKFCSFEQKLKMRQIYYLLRELQNLHLAQIVIGWTNQKEGTIWDKILRATEGKSFIKNSK